MAGKLKRFYSQVEVVEKPEGCEIQLDGRVLKTVAKRPLVLKERRLAEQVAAEWKAQTVSINADAMPATRLANIALDRTPEIREAAISELMMYAETDLLCHRAKEAELSTLQAAQWDKPMQFLQERFGVRMVTTKGVVPVPQPKESLDTLRAMIAKASDKELAALAMVTPLLGSVLLSVALWQKGISLDEALNACRVDEEYQAAKWGKDQEASTSWEAKAQELRACGLWLAALSA